MAIKPPKVVFVSAQETMRMAALGAAALAHSASRMASASFGAITPGLLQLLVPLGGAGWTDVIVAAVYFDNPKAERKEFQSARVKTSVSSMSAMV
jgi:hypothetical protein